MNLKDKYYGVEEFDYIAFIDIDGVFNHIHTPCTYEFLKESVDVINELYDKYNIKLVLSSSWRHAYSFAFMQKLFKDNGIKAPLIDRTYICFSKRDERISCNLSELLYNDSNEELEQYKLNSRENEIYEWLKMFKPKHFVILDDYKMRSEYLSSYQCLTDYFGENKETLGLRKYHLKLINNILEKENKLE